MGKKKRGHFCLGCGQYLANEKFSGKGHRKHLCKKCQKSGKKPQNKEEFYYENKWETIFELDENFAFIAGYTEGGVPFGITHEEWDEEEPYQDDVSQEQVLISIPREIAEELRNVSWDHILEKSIHHSIAVSLFITKSISIQMASALADCYVNDLIHFFQTNRIPWSIEEDGNDEYHESIDDLLIKIDLMIKDIKMN